jgi:Uncharacterised nucleotidyltransferase
MTLQSAEFPASGIGREAKLLVGCARVRIDAGQAERVRDLVRGGIDWGHLIELAEAHRVVPLLYWGLKIACPDAVPEITSGRLRDAFHASAGHNLFLADELLTIIALLERHGICAVPFKGPVLAASAYGDLSLRQFGDLDVVIHERDIPEAGVLLESRGYRPMESWVQTGWGQNATRLRTRVEYNRSFAARDGGCVVELHWAFAEPYNAFHPEKGPLWEHLRWVDLAGARVRTFAPEDSLLILCVHGARHRWNRLAWICDIAELCHAQPALDWRRALEEAQRLRVERILFLGLRLARDLLGIDLPGPVLRPIAADRAVESLANHACERLFCEPGRLHGILERPFTTDGISLESARFQFRVRDRLRDRLRYVSYLVQLALTPTREDRELLPLPTPLASLAYLVRPIRLIGIFCSRIGGQQSR